MTHIEKLQNIIRKPPMGLVDMLSANNKHGSNPLNINFDASFITSYIESKLPQITIGMQYGCRGVDINLLLANTADPDLVVETNYQNFLSLPGVKQRLLLENFTVMFSDFEENGWTMGNLRTCIKEVISKLQVMPKRIIILTAETNQDSVPELNIDIV